jgi:hypothetical protein
MAILTLEIFDSQNDILSLIVIPSAQPTIDKNFKMLDIDLKLEIFCHCTCMRNMK